MLVRWGDGEEDGRRGNGVTCCDGIRHEGAFVEGGGSGGRSEDIAGCAEDSESDGYGGEHAGLFVMEIAASATDSIVVGSGVAVDEPSVAVYPMCL